MCTPSSKCTITWKSISMIHHTHFTSKRAHLPCFKAGTEQPVHSFLGGKGLGIQQRTSVWVSSLKSIFQDPTDITHFNLKLVYANSTTNMEKQPHRGVHSTSSQCSRCGAPLECGPPIQQGWDKLPFSTNWLDAWYELCIQPADARWEAHIPGGGGCTRRAGWGPAEPSSVGSHMSKTHSKELFHFIGLRG